MPNRGIIEESRGYPCTPIITSLQFDMRIAFITPEFVTDYQDGGGLGNYLNRMGKLLVERGHQVEMFLPSDLEPQVLIHNGIRVERIRVDTPRVVTRLVRRTVFRSRPVEWYGWQAQALKLAQAMERRHRESPFDIIQSADYLAVGFAVRHRKGRVHLTRCSSAADLYNRVDGENSIGQRYREELERAAMRRADRVYAPSRFIADHFLRCHGIRVEVLRPPLAMEVIPTVEPPCGLPPRFLVFFGQLTERKGVRWLIESLARAFELEPTLRMVFVGRDYSNHLGNLMSCLGMNRSKVAVLHPLPKPELYALLQRAEAAVLPSLVDNLPNTVIESLMLGVPVIGTRGASIDELVEQNVTGELVAQGDTKSLAEAMLRVWRLESRAKKGFKWKEGIAAEMEPNRAVENFFEIAGKY